MVQIIRDSLKLKGKDADNVVLLHSAAKETAVVTRRLLGEGEEGGPPLRVAAGAGRYHAGFSLRINSVEIRFVPRLDACWRDVMSSCVPSWVPKVWT
jgi:hypothetical protein